MIDTAALSSSILDVVLASVPSEARAAARGWVAAWLDDDETGPDVDLDGADTLGFDPEQGERELIDPEVDALSNAFYGAMTSFHGDDRVEAYQWALQVLFADAEGVRDPSTRRSSDGHHPEHPCPASRAGSGRD